MRTPVRIGKDLLLRTCGPEEEEETRKIQDFHLRGRVLRDSGIARTTKIHIFTKFIKRWDCGKQTHGVGNWPHAASWHHPREHVASVYLLLRDNLQTKSHALRLASRSYWHQTVTDAKDSGGELGLWSRMAV